MAALRRKSDHISRARSSKHRADHPACETGRQGPPVGDPLLSMQIKQIAHRKNKKEETQTAAATP